MKHGEGKGKKKFDVINEIPSYNWINSFDNLPRVDAVQKKIGGNMQYVLQLAVTFLGVD